MYMIILVFSLLFFISIFIYTYNLVCVKKFLNEELVLNNNRTISNILLLIPVLREQSIITKTIEHFIHMDVKNINLYIVIVGTKREIQTNSLSTLEIVQKWINKYRDMLPNNISVDFCQANDIDGDRATQLNYAVQYIENKDRLKKIDYIGVYDADSLPSQRTLQEVVDCFQSNSNLVACQQPVHFAKTASDMAIKKENPILVANALYQSTWTAIRELPMWIFYYRKNKNKVSNRHLYLIGHGEFMKKDLHKNFQFPEYEITDGIQLGYRLGMSNQVVKPLHEFCNDDVPHSLLSLIKQHKRWFGGCMNCLSSYKWVKNKFKINSYMQVIDILWSQMKWAWATPTFLIISIISFILNYKIFYCLVCIFIIYCYIFPFIAHKIMKTNIKVRFIDWLCLPLAIVVKSIGPNIYLINKIINSKINYEKVER